MMPFLLILMVMLALVAPDSPEPLLGLGPLWSLGLTLAGVFIVWLLAELPTRFILRALLLKSTPRSRLARLYHRWRSVHSGITCIVYAASLLLADWSSTVRHDWQLQSLILVDELVVLAPLVLSLMAGWWSFWAVERGFHNTSNAGDAIPFWSRGAYVLFHVRHQLAIVLAPVLLFAGLQELIRELFPVLRDSKWSFAALGVVGLVILIITPWLLKFVWSARSLPAGPIRDRLEAAGRRLRFRYSDILLWDTRGGVANAMVTGLLPYPRYILLSDCLVDNLTPEQVEAVFGHEIGHIRHHHMPLYLVFFVLSMCLLPVAAASLSSLLGLTVDDFELSWGVLQTDRAVSLATASLSMCGLVGGYIYFVFGFLSRRCERQADVYGCKIVSCGEPDCNGHQAHPLRCVGLALCPTGIRTFISALDKVAELNGIPPGKRSWRHASITHRVAFLHKLLMNPTEEPRFQRRLLFLKCAVLAVLLALVGVLWLPVLLDKSPSKLTPTPTSAESPIARR